MARFRREAQVLASLNHPNIGSIYGLEESNNLRVLVLELVEGPTLADRMSEGAIPLEEVLVIARQIAEALAYGHEKGVTHRDLKPANIEITPEGNVKVLAPVPSTVVLNWQTILKNESRKSRDKDRCPLMKQTLSGWHGNRKLTADQPHVAGLHLQLRTIREPTLGSVKS